MLMRTLARLSAVVSLVLLSAAPTATAAPAESTAIRLPRTPTVSPDGGRIAFAWQRDIWTASIDGGGATRLTLDIANDSSPFFSPDGTQIAFTSDRSGSTQIHVMPSTGGAARQVTHTSRRDTLLGFTADGTGLVTMRRTDRGYHSSESGRLFVLDLAGETPPRMVLDVGIADADLSPDGNHVLFTRGRASWSRKGYLGAAALQLWHADLTTTPPTLTRLDEDRPDYQNVSSMNPMWMPSGDSYVYVSDPDGTFDLYHRVVGEDTARRLTNVGASDNTDDGVSQPAMSHDGKTLVFRRRFDLAKLDVATGEMSPIALHTTGDTSLDPLERLEHSSTSSAAFTSDGKQMAFVAGGDIWVMDRILKEPVRITNTPHIERSLTFGADDSRLFYVSDVSGEVDIWEATHDQEDDIWWLAEDFSLRQVTDDAAPESSLQLSPTGEHVAYVKGTELFAMDADGSDHRRVIDTWSTPSFDWSPDGRWLVYSTQDDNYNYDVFILPLDATRAPYNLSRHPDNDWGPVWSGDGKRIAFVSRRVGEEADIYYVNLTNEEEERTSRDQKLEEALEAMKKGKKNAKKRGGGDPNDDPRDDDEPAAGDDDAVAKEDDEGADEEADEDLVVIDFDGIQERMHRISIPDTTEQGLIWSPDGKTLAFTATVDAERAFYTIEFPDVEDPKKLASRGLSSSHWLEGGKEIVGISSGTPAALDMKGKTETFDFEVRTTRDWRAVRTTSFAQGWRAMRDRFYDERMNNRDWEAIRKKYEPVAAQTLGATEFSELMNMMLGELNASHMGHRRGPGPLPTPDDEDRWSPTTYHLGVRFAWPPRDGPGLVVESVIPGSPADRARSHIAAGERLLAIDGVTLDPSVDVDMLLTMETARDLELLIADAAGEERTITLRPTSSVSGLLYDEMVEANRRIVDELSDGTLGYLHIRGMNMSSFRQMEEDIFHAGDGKDGLVVDVRFNGGGSTTDHVLTALTQPVHAITQSRGSGEGYPQDRKIYASWSKPIVLMCNEHSFSNAEILSHAVKQLGRGKLVGMRTAGGVISTGSAPLLDGSSVRMPTRGWYLETTGEDMELNGCLPDIALWNPPGGDDVQLATAVETLLADVQAEAEAGGVKLVPAAAKRASRR